MASMQAPMVTGFRSLASRNVGKESMLTDIWDTPQVLRNLLQKHVQNGEVIIPGLKQKLPETHGLAGRTPIEVMKACSAGTGDCFTNKFTMIGSGSSWHAAILSEYMVEHLARIPTEVQYASEFRYRQPLVRPGDVFVFISNSGETEDAVESLRLLQSSTERRILTIAIVNEAKSTLAKECDLVIDVGAGMEVGVASTKVFSATGVICAVLSLALADACGTMEAKERLDFVKRLEELPDRVQQVLDAESKPLREGSALEIGECPLWDIGCQNVLAQNFIFLGRGFNFPVALEGAMKCKELAYIHAEGYPAAEMKHGPIALIDQFMPVITICPRIDPSYEKIKANIEEVKARNGATIAITETHNKELHEICEHVIQVPETHEYLVPLLAVIPLQLLAYMMGILRGNSVDNPRGLLKSVSKAANDAGYPATR